MLIQLQTEHIVGLQDRDPVIYKSVIINLLENKDQKSLEEMYARNLVIVYGIRKIRKQQRLPNDTRVGGLEEPD